jgi:extradiol dioxygenase family protein
MDYCAEVAWMKFDGRGERLPLEISFSSVREPDKVYILEMKLPLDLMLSLRDLTETKSLYGNKDRFHKRFGKVTDKVIPHKTIKMYPWNWRRVLMYVVEDVLPGRKRVLGVRSGSQKHFFKEICGFQHVEYASIRRVKLLGCKHRHSKLVRFACTGTEARTMAFAEHERRETEKEERIFKEIERHERLKRKCKEEYDEIQQAIERLITQVKAESVRDDVLEYKLLPSYVVNVRDGKRVVVMI